MARTAWSGCAVFTVSLCALTLANTASAGFIPFDRSRTVLSTSAILNDAPATIESRELDMFDRSAFEIGLTTNTSKAADASSAAMLISNGFDGSGLIEARATVISEATVVDEEFGFAAAVTTFSMSFRVTDEPLIIEFDWLIWIGLDQLIQVEAAEVMLESLSKEKPISGAILRRTNGSDEGTFSGELEPGSYRLTAKAVAVANTDLLDRDHIKAEAGFAFSLTVVPAPAASSLFAIALCFSSRRTRR